jgi:TolB-like protein
LGSLLIEFDLGEKNMKWQINRCKRLFVLLLLLPFVGCAQGTYFDPNMDFGSLQNIAVMPFQNLTSDQDSAERVRDTLMGMLLATGAVYVLPAGEVSRGLDRARVRTPATPSSEEIKSLGTILEVDGIITGVLKEYGAVRSGANSANVISLSIQMIETQSGRVVWAASSTVGGISVWDRLIGSGGEPMSKVTEEAINELLDDLFQ